MSPVVRRLLPLLLALPGCWTASYLAEQGAGQWHLLRARRPIPAVLADAAVPEATRARLRIAIEARDFGVRALGLRGGDGFTRFVDTGGRPVAWHVYAAARDRLAPYLHRFPITGAIPYLGYFSEASARREAARLEAMDLDTWVIPIAAYSTGGLLADPIYSSALEGSAARVVEVVLHEMLHSTVFVAGHAEWNESLATFVGIHGAAAFFRARGDRSGVRAVLDEARRRERDQAAYSVILEDVLTRLESLYSRPIARAEKLRLRRPIFAAARRAYLARFPDRRSSPLATQPLNNAAFVAQAVYHRGTAEQARLLWLAGGDLAAMVRLCRDAVDGFSDPLRHLRAL